MNGDARQDAFIARVRRALGNPSRRENPFGAGGRGGAVDEGRRFGKRGGADRGELIERLTAAAPTAGWCVTVLNDPQAAGARLAALVRERDTEWGNSKRVVAWDHPLIGEMRLPEALAPLGVPVSVTEAVDAAADPAGAMTVRRRVEKAYVGVTSADFCVAESATLVMRTRPGHARSASLLPSIHVAVIRAEQIVADLSELYRRLEPFADGPYGGITNCMTFVSGPSKTADIEATLVRGAHGPREVHLYVIAEGP